VAGDLKLGYAQFEELKTFSRFGARLDETTRKIIEHGRRIRACLKQPELAPVPVHAQIAVLLALTAELFDRVPLDHMTDAERALREAASEIPAEVRERLDGAETLSDEDRELIVHLAREVLARFQVGSDAKSESHSGGEPKTEGQASAKPEPEPGPEPEPEPISTPLPGQKS
jgi:F-type H+-transporting ATPase subunit alpha